MQSLALSPSSSRVPRLLFFALAAFPAVRSAAALFSRSRRDASRFLFLGMAQAAATGWEKTGLGIERWVQELGTMLEGGFHELGGRQRRVSLPPF